MEIYYLIEAINYIEDNLQNNIQLADIANVAGYSKFHFDRLFRYAVGEPLIEYVRKRKLTEASRELLTTDARIIEIAIKYGFQSQQSFTTTFKKYFNETPRQYRLKGHRLVLLEKSKLSQLDIDQIHAISQLKVRHIQRETFNVMGIEYFGSNQNNEIPLLWNRFLTELGLQTKFNHPKVYLGLCDHVPDYDPEKSEFSYMVCIEVDESQMSIPKGMITKTISKQDYVVFTHIGSSHTLETTYKYIYGTYFFKSSFELADAPDFERYDYRYDPNSETSEIDIYIPVKPTR
ncbi:AraC family transcriptional regulator [Fusibacter bizertensis]